MPGEKEAPLLTDTFRSFWQEAGHGVAVKIVISLSQQEESEILPTLVPPILSPSSLMQQPRFRGKEPALKM